MFSKYIKCRTKPWLITICLLLCSVQPLAVAATTLSINTAYTVPDNFANVGDIFVYGAGSISGNLPSGNSLNIGVDAYYNLNPDNVVTGGTIAGIPSIYIFHGSTLTVNDAISGVETVFAVNSGAMANINASISGTAGVLINNGTTILNGVSINLPSFVNNSALTVVNTDTSTGTLTNQSTGILTVNANATNGMPIANYGTCNFPVTFTNNATFTNYTTLNIADTIAGTGALVNMQGGVLNIGSTANISNAITNNANATANLSGVIASLINAGNSNIVGNTIVNGNITNTGTINLNNTMSGQTFTNNGIVNVRGTQQINVNTLLSPGVLNFTINNAGNYDSITGPNIIDLTNGGVVNVTSNFLGEPNVLYTWSIMSAPTINIDDSTVVNINPTLIKMWQTDNSDTDLCIQYARLPFAIVAQGDMHAKIAVTMDNLPVVNGTHLHAPLLHAVANIAEQSEYENALRQLIPNMSGNARPVTIQNATFTKIETRLTTVRNTIPHVPAGASFGDEYNNTAFWGGAFGTLAHQLPYSKSVGFNAKGMGSIIGIDKFNDTGDIYGLAFAVSNSNIYEHAPLTSITRTLGFHLIAYGSKDLNSEAYFLEWLITGITNKNKGNRYVMITGNDFSVNSSYRTAQGGIRLNFGQTTFNDTWQFSLIETISYSIFYQPPYNENNSPAALHVEPRKYSNYLTVGGGIRLAMVEDISWLRGAKELRFIGTYDAIASTQATTASFLNSVSDFTITNNAGRWGFQAGVNYTFTFFECMQLQLSYDFELRTKYTDNSAEIKLRVLF